MRIHSIFESISGEVGFTVPQGAWTTFIRLQGCPLRCAYCDTKDSQDASKGIDMPVEEIIRAVTTTNVIITGGEPLMQYKDCVQLIQLLIDMKHMVQVETNGFYKIPYFPALPKQLSWIIDIKGPSSGVVKETLVLSQLLESIPNRINSVIKFVIADFEDCIFAIDKANKLVEAGYIHHIAFSPIDANVRLIELINEGLVFLNKKAKDNLIISVQLHKIINMP